LYSARSAAIGGHDFASQITQVSSEVVEDLKIGRLAILFVARYLAIIPEIQIVECFLQCVEVEAQLVLRLPNDKSFDDGAGLGIASATVEMAFIIRLVC
jgi:NADPH:quinone reductase-like Zn-dependent oxidoreductase